MKIDDMAIKKIGEIFLHLQVADRTPVQHPNSMTPYRTGVAIAAGLTANQHADEVYCYTPRWNAWHKRIWAKRQKEIPFRAIEEFVPEAKAWRIGFSALPAQ